METIQRRWVVWMPVQGDLEDNNNLINRHSVAGRTRTVARTVGSDQGQ